jgi:membrane-bound lytic murein transglycosylase D
MTRPVHRRASRCALALALLAALAGCATGPAPLPTAEAPPAAPVVAAAPASAPLPAAAAASAPAPGAAASAPVALAAAAGDAEAAPTAVDPLRPEVRLDLDDRAAQRDLWERVRAGFAMPDLEGPKVRNRERWYADRPDYVQRMTERGSRYLFHIVEELDRRGMPMELALLPFIESAFNPEAMSSARASGMWQFIPSTGRVFELTQNVFRDDRRDVLESTRAALDYLQKLHGMFGDWHLALAAYNWGEGSVQRAIAKNRRARKPTDYASLRMPSETAYYVPKLQAVKNIVARPGDFGLELPVLANHPYFLAVSIERDIDVDLAARLAEMSIDEFRALNPQMNRPVILAAGTPRVLLPYDNANLFVRRLPLHDGPLASWTAWVAPKALRTADVAKQFDMAESDLREINHIPPRMMVQAGSTLLVPRNGHKEADVSEHIADNAMMALAPEPGSMRRLVLKAGRRGDTVKAVARRYRVSPTLVAQWNGMSTATRFRPGQKIVVYVATKAKPKLKAKAKPSASVSAQAGKAASAKRPVAAPRKSAASRAARSAKN